MDSQIRPLAERKDRRMGTKAWLVRCGLTVTFAGATLVLGACTRPGAGGTETPTTQPTVRASATAARTVTRTASPIAPSVAPSTAPSAAPVAPSAAPVAPSAAPSAAPSGTGSQKYVVQSGDTLSGIADQFGITIQQLIDANQLQNPDLLLPGQELTIPGQ
jgi:LysM repeat protein